MVVVSNSHYVIALLTAAFRLQLFWGKWVAILLFMRGNMLKSLFVRITHIIEIHPLGMNLYMQCSTHTPVITFPGSFTRSPLWAVSTLWLNANKKCHSTQTDDLFFFFFTQTDKKETFRARRLKVVSSESAPAYRKDVSGVVTAVIVKSSPPTIEGDQHLHSSQRPHCGRTDKMRVLPVYCLQLHPHLEIILLWGRRFLLRGSRRQRQS